MYNISCFDGTGDDVYKLIIYMSVSIVNSTNTPLSAGQTWTGSADDCLAWSSLVINFSSDADTDITLQFSSQGSDWDFPVLEGLQIPGGSIFTNSYHILAKYFRIVLHNYDDTNATYTRLQTILQRTPNALPLPTGASTASLQSDAITSLNTINATASGLLTNTQLRATPIQSIIVGQTDNGTYQNIGSDENAQLKVAIGNPKTAFGEISTANPEAKAQISFEYGINAQTMTTAVTGSGTVTTSGSLLILSTTAASSSSAQLISRRYLKYRPGQGACARGTMIFTTGASNSKQYAGVGNSSLTDGFFFGYSGTTFGIFYINNSSETHIPQSTWNVDVMDGSNSSSNPSGMNLDVTKGNVWQIKYQYLGFGCIYFYIEHDTDGEFTLVHVIRYPNSATSTSLSNPSLNLLWRVVNTTNTSNIVLKAGSGALFLEGICQFIGPKNAIDNNKSSITTLTNILTLKNATSYNTVTNRGQVRVRSVSCSYDGGNGVSTLQVILNTTLGGSPSYTMISGTSADGGATITSGQSIVSYDTAGTTISGGIVLFNTTLPRNYGQFVQLGDLDIFLSPGDTMTFAMKATASGTCSVAVNWVEDI